MLPPRGMRRHLWAGGGVQKKKINCQYVLVSKVNKYTGQKYVIKLYIGVW